MIACFSYESLQTLIKAIPNIERQLIHNLKSYYDEELKFFKSLLYSVPFLRSYRTDEVVFGLFMRTRIRNFNCGEYLFKRGDKCKEQFLIIKKGSVALSLTRKRQEMILDILKSGSIIGHYGMFDRRRIVYNAKIDSKKATAIAIRKKDLLEVLEKEKLLYILHGIENNTKLDYSYNKK